MADMTPVMRGIPLDEAIQLGTRYAGEIERKGMPRAAQTMEALTMAATELEALRKRCEAVEAVLRDCLQAMDVARDTIQPITQAQVKLHGLDPATANKLDAAASKALAAIAAAQEPSHG